MRELDTALRHLFSTEARDVPDDAGRRLLVPTVTTTGSPRRRWITVAAAALMAMVLAGGLAAGRWLLPESEPAPAGPDTSLAAPAAGYRWVSWHSIAVQVPETWRYAAEPTQACGRPPASPPEPYVATERTNRPEPGLACPRRPDAVEGFGVWGPDSWTPHVTWSDRLAYEAIPDGDQIRGEWTLSTRTLGSDTFHLLTRTSDQATREHILASAQTFERDQNGCAPRSEIASGFNRPDPSPARGPVHAVAVCRYGPDGLLGSVLLSPEESTAWARALDGAQVGSDDGCPTLSRNDPGEQAVLVLQRSDGIEERHLYLTYTCVGLFADSGPPIGVTRDLCAPLFAQEPLVLSMGSSRWFERCAQPRSGHAFRLETTEDVVSDWFAEFPAVNGVNLDRRDGTLVVDVAGVSASQGSRLVATLQPTLPKVPVRLGAVRFPPSSR